MTDRPDEAPRFRERRERARRTQAEIAARAGLPLPRYLAIEARRETPTPDEIAAIAAALREPRHE
jgi:transcriptional regulator with XRE-family HTH domain